LNLSDLSSLEETGHPNLCFLRSWLGCCDSGCSDR